MTKPEKPEVLTTDGTAEALRHSPPANGTDDAKDPGGPVHFREKSADGRTNRPGRGQRKSKNFP
jgi:hypothetical protein